MVPFTFRVGILQPRLDAFWLFLAVTSRWLDSFPVVHSILMSFRFVLAAGPVGLTTELNVTARPVTSQGLRGMQTQPLGPGRQIADRTYYLTELRK